MYLQLIFNSLVSGLLLSLVAAGFWLIFHTTKVFHLAHGALYVAGAYAFSSLFGWTNGWGGNWAWLIASLGAVVVVAGLAIATELLVYQQLARRKAAQAITMIASMGVYQFLINAIALAFGNETKFLQVHVGESLVWGDLVIAPMQWVQALVAITVLLGLIGLSRGLFFLKIRAVAEQHIVAAVMGIPVERIRKLVMVMGSLLAGVAAVLRMCDTGIDPHVGMDIALSGTVATVAGGKTSIWGTIGAAFIISFLQTGAEWFFAAQWKEGITYLLLIIVIMWRTEGVVSANMRIEQQ